MSTEKDHKDYWRINVIVIVSLLSIWFVTWALLGIVFVEPLNEFKLGGFPFGFWIAQQGSIYVFMVLVFFYWRFMNHMDDKYETPAAEAKSSSEEAPK